MVRGRNSEYGSQMSAAKRGSRRDGIALGNLVLNGRLEIREGRTDTRLSRDSLMQSRMFFECIEVLLIERFQKATDDTLLSSIDIVVSP